MNQLPSFVTNFHLIKALIGIIDGAMFQLGRWIIRQRLLLWKWKYEVVYIISKITTGFFVREADGIPKVAISGFEIKFQLSLKMYEGFRSFCFGQETFTDCPKHWQNSVTFWENPRHVMSSSDSFTNFKTMNQQFFFIKLIFCLFILMYCECKH